MQNNRIKTLIEQKLLTPAYVGMLAGLLVRSIALVLSVAIPYGTWPLLLKVFIEGCAAVGMVACADIVLSTASAATAALERQIESVRNSPDYQANPRLSPARYAQAQAALDARRELVTTGLRNERRREWAAVLFCGGITVGYGVLFGATVLAEASWVTVAVEIIGVASIPFITWYISAQYKEETAAPEERAKALSLLAVDQRLQTAHARFAAGDETDADIGLLDVATASSRYHNKMIRALRRPDDKEKYLTTPELYALLGIVDSSGQSSIRRIVRKAGENGEHGVTRDASSEAWLTPRAHIVDLFPQFLGGANAASARRTRTSTRRTSQLASATPDAELSEQGSGAARTLSEPGTAAPGVPMEAAAMGQPGVFAAQSMAPMR